MFAHLSLSLLLATSVISQDSSCGFPPDLPCLVQLSQYTIVGTVISNNLNDPGTLATPQNYNATIAIQCNYASFSKPYSDGKGVAGSTVLVTGFGVGNPRCQKGSSSQAIVNQTAIFFINVRTYRPKAGEPIVYQVTDVCVGELERDAGNLQGISNLLALYPENAIGSNYMAAPGVDCALPRPSIPLETTKPDTPQPGTPPLPNGVMSTSAALGTMLFGFVLTLAFLY